jgi:hypothetical protein
MNYTALCLSGELALAAMCLRRVGIGSRSYAAVLTQFSTVVTPPAPAAQNIGVKKGGRAAETPPQKVVNNAAAVQQERCTMRLYIYSGKLMFAAMYLRRVGIDGGSYAAALTQVSTIATPLAPAAQKKSRRRPAATLLGRCSAEQS